MICFQYLAAKWGRHGLTPHFSTVHIPEGPNLRRLEDHRPGTQGGPWVEIYQKISRGFQWI